jgi:hypothetical protein
MKNSKMKLIEVVSVSEATLLIGGMDLASMPTDNDNIQDDRGDKGDHSDGNFSGNNSNTDGKADNENKDQSRIEAIGHSWARRRRRARASLTIF